MRPKRKYGAFYRIMGAKHERWIRAFPAQSGCKTQMVDEFRDWLTEANQRTRRAILQILPKRSI